MSLVAAIRSSGDEDRPVRAVIGRDPLECGHVRIDRIPSPYLPPERAGFTATTCRPPKRPIGGRGGHADDHVQVAHEVEDLAGAVGDVQDPAQVRALLRDSTSGVPAVVQWPAAAEGDSEGQACVTDD